MTVQLTQKDFLKKATYQNNIWDFCANYYKLYIQNCSESSFENFMFLVEWNHNSDETIEIDPCFSDDEYQNTSKALFPIVKKIIENLIIENLDEHSFYSKLYQKILDDVLFATELERICALVILVLEPKLPYFKLNAALSMNDDKFQQISASIQKDISKAYFVLQYGYSQKTELASQLYSIMKVQKTEEEKIVLLSNILGYYDWQLKLLYDNISTNDSDATNTYE